MKKYITVNIPDGLRDGVRYIVWWHPDDCPIIIEQLEKDNPDYEFVQFVTPIGNGGFREYAIMKIKLKSRD